MTATILVLLALIAILVIARINKDANLGSSLLITLALSLAVGIGVKSYTSKQSDNINAKIENAVSTNQNPMQLYLPEVMMENTCLTGVVGKDYNWIDTNSVLSPTCVHNILEMTRGSTKPIDSS